MGGLLLSGCSFNLPGRACDSPGCATGDMGSPADMTPALPDPNTKGPFGVATAPVTLANQPSLKSGLLYLPSDDSATLSAKSSTYPLVMLAPAKLMDPQQLADYANRLASHGIVVALYQPNSENDENAYRLTALNLLNTLLGDLEPVVARHLDTTHVGLAGYELGGEMSVAMASMMPSMRGLALIDPQAIDAPANDIKGLEEMAKIKLTGDQPVLILGEDRSNSSSGGGMRPCTVPSANYLQFYNASTTKTIALKFTNAAHGEFTSDYPNIECLGGTMDKAETKRLAMKYLTAYFQLTLLEKPQAKDFLTGAGFTADAAVYSLTQTEK